MPQWLHALAVLLEEPDSITSTHKVAQNTILQESQALFWPLWSQPVCGVHTYIQAKHL